MMVHRLVQLDGAGAWREICELRFVLAWTGPPEWMRDRPAVGIDWGASLYEASLAEVRRLIGPPGDDPVLREIAAKQNAVLDALPLNGRYGVIWLECY